MNKRAHIRRALEILLLLVSLVGCSAKSGSEPPVSLAVALQAISNFKLLNEKGEAAPSLEWARGRAPFGVLLRWDKRGLAQCNVSHLVGEMVGTNAHCVSSQKDAIHQIRYYDRAGVLRSTSPVSTFKMGREHFDDVALLKIPLRVASQWDAVAQSTDEFRSLLLKGEAVPNSEPVVIWALDPLEELGAQFLPRQCIATPQMPRLGTEFNGSVIRERPYLPSNKTLSSDLHLFMSGCSRPTVIGNSGALITTVDFIPRGIFSWELARSHFSAGEVFRGADGEWVRVNEEYPGEDDPSIFQFGSRLFPFLSRPG